MPRNDLDAALLAAHAQGDKRALAHLYGQAAEGAGSLEARCFYLTHAYVYALDEGLEIATQYHAALKAHGREE